MSDQKSKIKLFISYAHDDDAYFKEFDKGLKKAIHNTEHFEWGKWSDTDIHIGSFWDETIQNEIQNCNIAMLLVSMSFMASRYIKEKEFKEFIKRNADRGVLIIPIVFAPCDFNRWEDLGKLQFFKPSGKEYEKPDIENFTFADLIKFAQSNGVLIPNPNIDRYILNLVKKIEDSYSSFLENNIIKNDIHIEIQKSGINRLSEVPKSKPYFTGRDSEMLAFKEAIDNKVNFIAIDGPGGIGKTQFISKCIENYISNEKIIWYDCTTSSQFDTLVSEAGYPELLKGKSKTDREKFSAFKDKIQEHEYYIVLDNFQETNSNPVFKEFLLFIQEYLRNGCIIVIDRDDIRSSKITPTRIHIEGFKKKKLEYAKALIKSLYRGEVKINDNELENLCEQLHGYPLAIQFAVYLLSQGETPSNIIAKIVHAGNEDNLSERLLNEIFTRPDATPEEKEFITQFSVFTGKVSEELVHTLIPDSDTKIVPRKLQKKNLLNYSDGQYEMHPLVREFCYRELYNKEEIHEKIAEYYIKERLEIFNPLLEESIFYHLSMSNQWKKIKKEIEEKGRQFILLGQLGLLKEILDKLDKNGINNTLFYLLDGDIAEKQGRWDDAISFYEKAKNIDTINGEKIEGIIKYGEILYRKGEAKKALECFENAEFLSKENNFLKENALALNDISIVYGFLGNYEEALKKIKEALDIRYKIQDKSGIAESLSCFGDLLFSLGDLNDAKSKFEESLKYAIEVNDIYIIATAISNIGLFYQQKDKYEIALEKYKESLRLSIGVGAKQRIADCLNSIGNIYRLQNKKDEALEKYEESLRLVKELGDKKGISASKNNLAILYKVKEKNEDALKLFIESLEISLELDDKNGIITSYINLGSFYCNHKNKQYQKSISFLFKSLYLSNLIGLKPRFDSAIRLLIEIRDKDIGLEQFRVLAKNEYEKMEEYMKKYIPIKELLKEPFTAEKKIGRNDSCPCGGGKKYKQCHGKK